jgi:CRISPR-associated protein Csb2
MIVVELKFPAGRFHGTPWGRHVNEGAVEWPPSPWRLLRALIATWHLKAQEDISPETLKSLITSLANVRPSYSLPKASLGHTRHYMPDNAAFHKEGGKQVWGSGKDKIFDAFIQIESGKAIQVCWDVELTAPERKTLEILLERLGYFGRAESLVEGKLFQSDTSFKPNAAPLADNAPVPDGQEIVRLLAPLSGEAYLQWSQKLLAEMPPGKLAKGKAKKKVVIPSPPKDIYEALYADTSELQAAGWSLPPGAAHVNYTRDAHAFDVAPLPILHPHRDRPTVARFAIASQVLPRITQALSVAERVHQSLCKISDNASVFTGHDPEGKPLTGHQHAYIWCEALGERDAITHITAYAREGFSSKACLALRKLRKVWGHGGHDLQLVLLGLGKPDSFADSRTFGEPDGSRVWESYTPFVPTRHAKTYRDGRPKLDEAGWIIGSPEHDLRRLLSPDKLALLKKIETRSRAKINDRELRWLQFGTERQHGGGIRAHASGAGFRLSFSQPIKGPINLGYGAHFGLGLFMPLE